MLNIFKKKAQVPWTSYMRGDLIPLEDVPDEIFSKKLMGDGVAILANDCEVYAPCAGEIVMIAPSKHAIAIKNKHDMQLLIHIGLDSALHPEGTFDVHVKVGEQVKEKQLLVSINKEYAMSKSKLFVPLIIVENPKQIAYKIASPMQDVIATQSIIVTYE